MGASDAVFPMPKPPGFTEKSGMVSFSGRLPTGWLLSVRTISIHAPTAPMPHAIVQSVHDGLKPTKEGRHHLLGTDPVDHLPKKCPVVTDSFCPPLTNAPISLVKRKMLVLYPVRR